MGSNLPVLLGLIFLYIVSKVIDFFMVLGKIDQIKILEGEKKTVFYWVLKVKNFFGLSFYWAIFNGMQLDLLIGGWAIFKVDVRSDFYTIFSAFLTIFIIVNILIYLFMITKAYYLFVYPKYQKLYPEETAEKLEKNNQLFLEIFDSINLETPKNLLFLFFQTLNDCIIPLVLIFGAETPYAQVIPIFFLSLTVFGFLLFLRPLKSKFENTITLINLGVSTLMYLSLLVLHFADSLISETIKSLVFGNLMILAITISILFNLGIGAWTSIAIVWQFIKSFKSKVKDSKEPPKDELKNDKKTTLEITEKKPLKKEKKVRFF